MNFITSFNAFVLVFELAKGITTLWLIYGVIIKVFWTIYCSLWWLYWILFKVIQIHISLLFELSFWRFIFILWLGHVSLFLHLTCSCILGCVDLEKESHFFQPLQFASYRDRTSSVSQARDLRASQNFYGMCVISGLVHVVLQWEVCAFLVQDFLVSNSPWCLSKALQTLWHCWKSAEFWFVLCGPQVLKVSHVCQCSESPET